MNWEKAFRKSAKAYFEGKGMKQYIQSRDKPMKYTKEYLDDLANETLPEKNVKDLKDVKGLDIEKEATRANS